MQVNVAMARGNNNGVDLYAITIRPKDMQLYCYENRHCD
jgi:hypothetical protein